MAPWSSSPAAIAVENRLLRAAAVLRVVLLVNTVVLGIVHFEDFERRALAVAGLALMGLWTAAAIWAYAEPRRRTLPLLVADLVLALAMLLATPLVKGDGFTSSLPGFWIVGALVAWAVHYRAVGGLVTGLLLAVADLVQRTHVGQSDYGNAFLLVVGGAIVGFMCESLQRMATDRDAAERAAAAAEERARLARAVHDGVLQALALIQRRGLELGGGAAHLGRLAAEQERELRGLIRSQDGVATLPGAARAGTVDVVSELAQLERRGAAVTVSTPGFPVMVPATTARELVAAAGACLDNVRAHVGEEAPAFVLLQAFPDRLELSVRDDGPGIPAGRLEEAAAQGRLGVTESIRGRIAALGGTADVQTGSFGTEWELVVPLGSSA